MNDNQRKKPRIGTIAWVEAIIVVAGCIIIVEGVNAVFGLSLRWEGLAVVILAQHAMRRIHQDGR